MPTVKDVLDQKGPMVFTIHPSVTVLSATRKMNRHKLGALVVADEGQVVGMFTERDVLRRIVAEQRDPSTTTVADVMTEQVICCTPQTDLDDVAAIMKEARVRHLPVCATCGTPPNEPWHTPVSHEVHDAPHGPLLGLISIGDVNATYAHNREATLEFLNGYIYGRV